MTATALRCWERRRWDEDDPRDVRLQLRSPAAHSRRARLASRTRCPSLTLIVMASTCAGWLVVIDRGLKTSLTSSMAQPSSLGEGLGNAFARWSPDASLHASWERMRA